MRENSEKKNFRRGVTRVQQIGCVDRPMQSIIVRISHRSILQSDLYRHFEFLSGVLCAVLQYTSTIAFPPFRPVSAAFSKIIPRVSRDDLRARVYDADSATIVLCSARYRGLLLRAASAAAAAPLLRTYIELVARFSVRCRAWVCNSERPGHSFTASLRRGNLSQQLVWRSIYLFFASCQ